MTLFESPGTDSTDIQPNSLPSPPILMPASTSVSVPTTISTTPFEDKSLKEAPSRVTKRQLNTLAARRYRQRRVDRMNELEAELERVKRERDEFKMRVSKLEGETEALRGMLKEKKDK